MIDDFNLSILSPCINTGDTLSKPDPDGTIADVGTYYFHHLPPDIVSQPEDEKTDDGDDAQFAVYASTVMSYLWAGKY